MNRHLAALADGEKSRNTITIQLVKVAHRDNYMAQNSSVCTPNNTVIIIRVSATGEVAF